MIRRHETGFRAALMGSDAALASALIVIVFAARFGPEWPKVLAELLPQPAFSVTVFCLGWIGVLAAHGLYRPRARWSVRSDAIGVARAAVLLAFGTIAVLFMLGWTGMSRFALLAIFPLLAVATIIARAGLRVVFREARRRGRNFQSILIVGTGRVAIEFDRKISERWDLGLRVVGFIGPRPARGGRPEFYLGPLDNLSAILHEQVIDEVAICLPAAERARIETVYQISADEGKTIRIPIELPDQAFSVGRVEDLDGMRVLSVASGPDHVLALIVKRVVDVVGATIGLIVLSPVFLVVAVAILVSDGRPVLFNQERAGVNGRHFRMVKFRTMTRDADAQRDALRAQNEISGSASFKMTNDPRITPIGRILRKTSVDELPQLLNVLKGEMSLVGPRPHPFDDVAGYHPWQRRRLSMKPGITGLWQIAGRREPSFDRWVQLDLEYIDHWSIWLDLRLLIQTIPAMLRAEGR
jgi:exopolysaccharide biosynthesis polyprenyl glycosylphosphotransferase